MGPRATYRHCAEITEPFGASLDYLLHGGAPESAATAVPAHPYQGTGAGSPATTRVAPAHSTLSRRGFGVYRLPALAAGIPSRRTTSAVKSLSPRIRDDPTP